MTSTQELESVSTKIQRIAELAKRHPDRSFVSLSHHIDLHWLWEAYERIRKDGAPGIDGVTAEAYEQDLLSHLQRLLEAVKSGSYKAPPVRRVWIAKADGNKTRPIGIPTLEDKILQRAVVMILEAIYEQDFLEVSYGFRPNRSAHQALDTVWTGLSRMGGGWVLEIDIKSYFDRMDHSHLRRFLERRVRDGVLRWLIDKWLKAGVLEDGQLSYREEGTPQGGVVSPILANLYLHHVLDTWFEGEVKPRLVGASSLVRYADDAVLMFANEADARKVLAVLPKRFARFGLELHPTKTRLVHFIPPTNRKEGEQGTFDLLGFTHYWGKSRRGLWVIKRKTAGDRLSRSLKRIKRWCRRHRHDRLKEQHEALSRKLKGHYAYYGIVGNRPALFRFREEAVRIWVKWLGRRSQRPLTWATAAKILHAHPLPDPRPWRASIA